MGHNTAPSGLVSTPVHVVMTTILGIIVTALCCYAFYLFRTSSTREQTFTDAMKVIRASTEIVASLAERGVPAIRNRVDELESRSRTLERTLLQARSAATFATSEAAVVATPVLPQEGDAALLAARKAARLQQQQQQSGGPPSMPQ